MNVQHYFNVARLGIVQNIYYVGYVCLVVALIFANTNAHALGKYFPLIDLIQLAVATVMVGYLLLQGVVFKNNATVRTNYFDWLQSFGQLSYFVDKPNDVHSMNVTMLMYFTIILKAFDVVDILLRTLSNEFIRLAIISVLCCIQIYGLLQVVSVQNPMYPVIACTLIALNALVICDSIIHVAYWKFKILPKTIYDRNEKIVKKFSGVLYDFQDNIKGHTLRLRVYWNAFICGSIILLIFIKDVFFKGI